MDQRRAKGGARGAADSSASESRAKCGVREYINREVLATPEMPFGHAAFHRAKIRLIRHQWRHGRYPAEQQRKHRRQCLQTGEDSFSYVLFHNAAIFVSNDGRSIHF
jgi:hypothetical protein